MQSTPQLRPSPRCSLFAAVLLALVVAVAFQGSRGLYETTEGRYAESAREMAASGDWLTPRLDGEAHWSKPPLTYWVLAAGIEAFGENEWALRAFNALAFLGVALAVYGIGRAMWGEDAGLYAMLVASTSPFLVAGLNSIPTDMPLTLWETVAVLCFWLAARARGARRALAVDGMWVAFGLAFLTKGPPGLLPLASILVYAVVRRRHGGEVPRLARAEGLFAFLLVAFAWYGVQAARDPSLLRYFLTVELWDRMATNVHHRNGRWFMPLVLYLPALTLGLGLWFFDALPLAPRARRAIASWRDSLASPAALFLVLWLAIPLLVLSLARSRLPFYVLPLVPPVALALARSALRVRGRDAALRRGARVAVAGAILCVVLKGAAARVPSASNMAQLRDAIAAAPGERVVAVGAGSLYGLDFYLDGRLERADAAELRDIVASGARSVLILRPGPAPALNRACDSPGVVCRDDLALKRHYRICRVSRE